MNLFKYWLFWMVLATCVIAAGLILGFVLNTTVGIIVMGIGAIAGWALIVSAMVERGRHQNEIMIILTGSTEEKAE